MVRALGPLFLLAVLALARPAVAEDAAEARARRRLLSMARAEMQTGREAAARVHLEGLLARDPADDEARAGLARLDAWEGRGRAAEEGYRAVLSRHPADVEVRSGLVDLLLWQGRWTEAEVEIARGLSARDDAALWTRRARLRHWQSDERGAQIAIRRALALAPTDPEVTAVADQIYVGELRVTPATEQLPPGYADSWGGQVALTVRWERAELRAQTTQVVRGAGLGPNPHYNGFYSLSAMRPLARWLSVGAEVGFGAPVTSLPIYLGRGILVLPMLGPVSASLTYSALAYPRDRIVHSLAPVLTIPAGDTLRVDVIYWLDVLAIPEDGGLPADTKVLHALGVQIVWRAAPRVSLSTLWTRGTGLDEVADVPARLSIDAQSLRIALDVLTASGAGIAPAWRIEVRRDDRGVVVPIHRIELGAYSRW